MVEELELYRKEIAEINHQILSLVKARFQLAAKIGAVKKRRNLPITDLKVENEVLITSLNFARAIGLDEGFSLKLINLLIAEAVKLQKGILTDRSSFLYNIFEKAKSLEARGDSVIRLEVGEPDLSSPVELKEALKDNLYASDVVGYSSSGGLQDLREAIADDLNQQYGTDITENQVLITPGGKFAIFSAILSMVSPGDRVVVPEPTWPVYGSCIHLANGRLDTIHTRLEDLWNINMGEVTEVLKVNPKLFILCSPNNPTGKVFSAKLLGELAVSAERKGIYLLSDEVYSAFSPIPFKSILQVMNSNFIYVSSFSKRYGMTGWRIGYAVSDVKTIARMQSILQLSVTCVPEFIQCAALKALTMNPGIFNNFAKSMKQRLDAACKDLDSLPLSYVRPNGGMYIFPKVKIEGFHSDVFANQLLEAEKVAIAPGEAFGDYPEHFRISLGTGIGDIKTGIKKIGEALKNWR
ncbi:MAG: aminotransferase class I/II-fold pyridoxal phosphate-dependent enzyme [Candidatus Bathyarchaeota archaeon]